MSFWSELRRRHVFRVGGAYVIVAWLLVQVAVALEAAMGLPSWFDGLIVALLILGFPVALLITWAFELTPEGIKPSAPPSPDAPAQPVSIVDAALVVALVAVLGVSAVGLMRPPRVETIAAAPEERAETAAPRAADAASQRASAPAASVAVLPFLNLSSDPEQAYFSDGLADQLLNQLAQIEGLRVAGRTSSFAFRGQNPNFQQIGETLGVATLLEGSVQKSGDRLRIIAQLVNAEDGYHLWSESYNRELDDIFAVQDEIAMAVADALSVTLGLSAATVDYGGTESFEAYDHFLRGRALEPLGDPASLTRAAQELRQAVAIDPEFGQAWTELAWALSTRSAILPGEAAQIDPERDAAADRALEIAPESPLAHVMKAWSHIDQREWLSAYRECEHAYRAPPDREALGLCAGLLTEIGRVREALPDREAWIRADPLSVGVSVSLSRQYVLLGMKDAFLREVERARGLQGDISAHEAWRLLMLLGEGAPLAEVEEALARFCGATPLVTNCEALQVIAASPEDAPEALRRLLDEQHGAAAHATWDIAWFAAYFGDDELALDAWEVFEPAGAGALYQTIWAPLFSGMRRLPRFKTFVDEGGFLEVWRESGEWPDFCRPLGEDDFECF